MSEDERELEVESEEDEDLDSPGGLVRRNSTTDKRAHHNALERKRRDHIKDSFCSLRDAIPTMQGDKSSRAQILKKASEYITHMRRKNLNHQKDIEDLKRQNQHLERQIRALERAKSSGDYVSSAEVLMEHGLQEDASTLVSSSASLAATSLALNSSTSRNNSVSEDANGSSSSAYYIPAASVDDGSDNSDTSSSSRVIAPGQSLLLNTSEQPPKKKAKS